MTETRDGSSRSSVLVAAVGVLAIGAGSWLAISIRGDLAELEGRVAELGRQTEEATRVLKLLRIERGSEGLGITAVLEQIDAWAPQLQSALPPSEVKLIRSRLDDALSAIEALGADAYDPIYRALEREDRDEARKWLVRACLRANPDRAKQLLIDLVRGTKLSPTPRLRFIAADELVEIDKALCGKVLRDVLEFESHQGITRPIPPRLRRDYEEMNRGYRIPDFYNFIRRYAATQDPELANTMQMMIGRPEHDLITYKECIAVLGDLKCRDAVKRIRELYENPPAVQQNPMFLVECLVALQKIQGSEACPFFRKALRTATFENVRAKLQDLIKNNCG